MPFAIISDIHSNLNALQAVFSDIADRGIDEVYCLGDVVGYGPQPCECLDLVMEHCTVCLMGNHDYAMLYEPYNFNIGAESASFWTRRQLEAEPDAEKRSRRWDFLGELKLKHIVEMSNPLVGETTFVHGSPRRPVNEYVFPDDVYTNAAKVHSVFERIGKTCFVGHSHVPGAFVDTPDFYAPDELDDEFELSAKSKLLINVGSVGQPRDRDKRASYAICDEEKIIFIRLEYDVDDVVDKIKAIDELDDYLGSRLLEGR